MTVQPPSVLGGATRRTAKGIVGCILNCNPARGACVHVCACVRACMGFGFGAVTSSVLCGSISCHLCFRSVNRVHTRCRLKKKRLLLLILFPLFARINNNNDRSFYVIRIRESVRVVPLREISFLIPRFNCDAVSRVSVLVYRTNIRVHLPNWKHMGDEIASKWTVAYRISNHATTWRE